MKRSLSFPPNKITSSLQNKSGKINLYVLKYSINLSKLKMEVGLYVCDKEPLPER